MRRLDSFPQLLHAYFYDWMAHQRNASRHTVLSYRDAWRLFLRFVAKRGQKEVAKIILTDLTPITILAFLDHLEKDRSATIATRNCRLAALHSFFTFLADREPLATAQCDAVLRIPAKRGPKHSLGYLEEDEVKASGCNRRFSRTTSISAWRNISTSSLSNGCAACSGVRAARAVFSTAQGGASSRVRMRSR